MYTERRDCRKIFSILILFILSISMACGQQNRIPLSKKWINMLDHAETYQSYKVLKKADLKDFEKNMSDTITVYQKAVKVEKHKVVEQANTIANLKKNLAETNVSLEKLKQEKDGVSFLGISANKYVYLSLLFLISLVFFVLIIMVFVMYKKSQVITVQKVDAHKKIEEEYTEYKQTKFDAEKKLKREMQTLLNRLEELKRK